MTKMNGLELARRMRSERPVPVLLATGYAASVSRAQVEESGIRAIVRKPFDLHELAETVHEVLNKPAVGGEA